jgi:hypothetical protein
MMSKAASDDAKWINVQDILHPECFQLTALREDESAVAQAVLIDEPDRHRHRSRWEVVWAEATHIEDNNNETNDGIHTPQPVNGSKQQPINDTAIDLPSSQNAPTPASTETESSTNPVVAAPFYHGNLLEVIIGMSFIIAAVAGTLAFEIATMAVYILATILHRAAMAFRQNYSILLGFALQLSALIFVIVAQCLMLIDFALLIESVIFTEAIAISVGIVNALLSCFTTGVMWHQYIRKVCHLTRWAFRDLYPSTEPKRIFPLCQNTIKENAIVNPEITPMSDSTISAQD